MDTQLVNLTPHELNIFNQEKVHVINIPSSGTIARVSVTRHLVQVIDSVPVFSSTYGTVENLPEPTDGVVYIVSSMVKQAVPSRDDVLSPGELIRDDAGRPIGAIGLSI